MEIMGVKLGFSISSLTFCSQDVNFVLGIPTHQYFHSSLIKNIFLKKIKIINDKLNLV